MTKLNRSQLARDLGVARSTLYAWLNSPGCPDPDKDPDAFREYARGMKAENRGGGVERDVAAAGCLKEAKLRAEVVHRWQQISDYEQTMLAAARDRAWTEIVAFLSALKAELRHLDHETVNEALQAAHDKAAEPATAAAEEYDNRLRLLHTLVTNTTEADQ